MAGIADIREEAKYFIHADGKGDVTHCVSILIADPEVATLYDGNNAYQISVSPIRAILSDSHDKPLALGFPDSEEGAG